MSYNITRSVKPWVPPEARWARLQAHTRQPTIRRLVDDAMACTVPISAIL